MSYRLPPTAPPVNIGKLFEKLPPSALEAEVAVLGSMILDPEVIGDIVQILSGPGDFYKPAHMAIYRALCDLFDANLPVDMVHLAQRLKDAGELDGVGGLDYLLMITESVPTAVAGPSYAKLVREKAHLRGLIDAAGQILQRAYTSADPVEDQVDDAEQMLFGLAETKVTNEAASLNELVQQTYDALQAQDGRAVTGIETGFFELDEMTSGLQNGEVVIVAARPSMGKTGWAMNVAEHVAVNLKLPVAVFSMEMGKLQLAHRLLCSSSGVNSQRLRRNTLSDDEWQKLQVASGILSEAPLFIDDSPGLSILGLRAKARRMAQRHGVKLVVIDYLQLMSGPRTDSREQEVSGISRGVKALARELNLPVILLSQLNRGPEAREGHRPRMSDLRESGSIEQDADMVLLLHRDDYYHRGEETHVDNNVAEVIVAKNRNGPTGVVKLHFNSATTRFGNLQTHGAQA